VGDIVYGQAGNVSDRTNGTCNFVVQRLKIFAKQEAVYRALQGDLSFL
jgi:hypothetical protein